MPFSLHKGIQGYQKVACGCCFCTAEHCNSKYSLTKLISRKHLLISRKHILLISRKLRLITSCQYVLPHQNISQSFSHQNISQSFPHKNISQSFATSEYISKFCHINIYFKLGLPFFVLPTKKYFKTFLAVRHFLKIQ